MNVSNITADKKSRFNFINSCSSVYLYFGHYIIYLLVHQRRPLSSFLYQQLIVKGRMVVHGEGGAGVELVQVLDTLAEEVLDGGERGHDGGRPEAVGDGGEVAEVPLDGGVQQGLGPRVAQRAAVLVEELHQLVAHIPATIHTYFEHAQWTPLPVYLNVCTPAATVYSV